MAEDICFWAEKVRSPSSTTGIDMRRSKAKCVSCRGQGGKWENAIKLFRFELEASGGNELSFKLES